MHGRGAEQVERAANGKRTQFVQRLGRRDLLAELGQMFELEHALAHLLVESRVLDGAGNECRTRSEERRLGLGEFPGSLGVETDDADRISGSADQGHRHEGLEPLLLQFRHVVEARVFERVLADERRLATFEHPPREALPPRQADPAGEILVGLRRGIEIETVTVGGEEVDEAGMDGACIREQAHDRREHLLKVERGRHRRDDLGEESLPALLYVARRGYVRNRTRGGVEDLHT